MANIGFMQNLMKTRTSCNMSAGDEYADPFEVTANAISGCSAGKGKALAQAIFERYRWKVKIS